MFTSYYKHLYSFSTPKTIEMCYNMNIKLQYMYMLTMYSNIYITIKMVI